MLPRPKSIFDDADLAKAIRTGAPPRYGPGSGFLYVVTKSLVVGGKDQGPGVLLVQEYMPGGSRHLKWGPPGGQSDKTDHSALHAALREFGEEVGVDWRNLGNANTDFRFVRLQTDPVRLNKQTPPIPTANESWMLFVDLDAQACENALFNADRSTWRLGQRMNMPPKSQRHGGLAKETAGYAFVPLEALLAAPDRRGRRRPVPVGPAQPAAPLRLQDGERRARHRQRAGPARGGGPGSRQARPGPRRRDGWPVL